MGPCLRRGTSYLSEAGVQRLARVEQFLDRVDRDLEARLVGTVEFDLDDLLDPARADLHRHANIEAIDAVLAVDTRGAGQEDRKRVVSGKGVSVRVDLGGRRRITKNNTQHHKN